MSSAATMERLDWDPIFVFLLVLAFTPSLGP
jgi:hypothetical protein